MSADTATPCLREGEDDVRYRCDETSLGKFNKIIVRSWVAM